MAFLEVKDLTRIYGKKDNTLTALDHVSFSVEKGEFVAITGASGSGKSTLLHLLGTMDEPQEGSVFLEGESVLGQREAKRSVFRRRKIGFVFQEYNLVPVLNVEENIQMPVRLDGKRMDPQYLEQLLKILGLTDRRYHLPEELSGSLLDLGCGYGVIGVTLGRRYPGLSVTMSDVNERAVELSRRNAQRSGVQAQVMQSDGYASIPFRRYDWILQNPPIRAGKSVIYAMFAEGARRLEPNGALWLVIRKQQGAESAAAYLKTLFGQVEAVTKKGGYWVLRCTQPVENA